MSNQKSPLTATISSATLSLKGVDHDVPGISIPGYRGEELFCHVKLSGNVLMITVDETQIGDNRAVAGAIQAVIFVSYRDVHMPPFSVTGISYAPNAQLNPRLMVSSDLTYARLVITDQPPQDSSGDAVRLAFVLVQGASLDEPRYRLEWIQNPVFVESPGLRTESSVVAPSSDPATAMGPMGLATP
jgi:hypothetical protein